MISANAMNTENIELPPGKIYGNNTELTIRTLGRLTTEQQFRDLIIREDSAGIVRLGDVPRVEIGPEHSGAKLEIQWCKCCRIRNYSAAGRQQYYIANEFNKRLQK